MLLMAAQLTHSLGGRWNGHSGIAFCPSHNNHRTPALSISVGESGTLLFHCFGGCDFVDIVQAIKALGYDLPYKDKASVANPDIRCASIKEERRAAHAEAIWKRAHPIAGTPAGHYLRNRGISCPLPDTFRYHPDCWHGPSARRYPAMIALVEGSVGTSIHRTYILPDGTGKAKITPEKMMLGPTTGGAVKLKSDNANAPLVVAEGIETALSLASGLLSAPGPIWAALSASGMTKVNLPRRAGSLIVAMDGDVAGRSAGLQLAQRAHAMGWKVSLLEAPNGQDWNDALIEKGLD